MKDATVYTNEVLEEFRYYFGDRKPKEILDILTHNIYIKDSKSYNSKYYYEESLNVKGFPGEPSPDERYNLKYFDVNFSRYGSSIALYALNAYNKERLGGQQAQFIYNLENNTNFSPELNFVHNAFATSFQSKKNWCMADGSFDTNKDLFSFDVNDPYAKIFREAYYNVKGVIRLPEYERKIPSSMQKEIIKAEVFVKDFIKDNKQR